MRVKRTIPLPKETCIQATQTCACFNLRKAARAVTRIYDDGLRPTGLSSGQFVILLAAQIHGSATIRELAGMVGVDRTVLSRNLKPLLACKLIRAKTGLDRRTRRTGSVTQIRMRVVASSVELLRKAAHAGESLQALQA